MQKKYAVLSFFTVFCATAIDNPHFYRAPYFYGEPRFEEPWLTTFDISYGGGKTHTARNKNGEKTTLLNIFGTHNIQQLAANITTLNPTNPLDAILIDLHNLPERSTFAQLEFRGKFSILEANINLYQNLCQGFFLQLFFPIRDLRISNVSFTDLSPDDGIFPNKNNPTWQAFLREHSAIFNNLGLDISGAHRIGFGDVSLLAGWAYNYEDTVDFDYVDIDSRIGVLFPTGGRKSLHKPFDIPLGYDGFFAIPVKFNASLGALEWFTMGIHLGALFFLKRTQNIRIKTAAEQRGFIKLAVDSVEIDPGTIWDASVYIKADHVVKGFSFLLGYSFTNQDSFCIEPKNSSLDSLIINNDEQFRNWQMHTLHLLIEYDFAQHRTDIGPRIGFFYNRILAGKRIFDTAIAATYIGFDISHDF